MAETTTATSWAGIDLAFDVTRHIADAAMSATEVPPNFITIRAMEAKWPLTEAGLEPKARKRRLTPAAECAASLAKCFRFRKAGGGLPASEDAYCLPGGAAYQMLPAGNSFWSGITDDCSSRRAMRLQSLPLVVGFAVLALIVGTRALLVEGQRANRAITARIEKTALGLPVSMSRLRTIGPLPSTSQGAVAEISASTAKRRQAGAIAIAWRVERRAIILLCRTKRNSRRQPLVSGAGLEAICRLLEAGNPPPALRNRKHLAKRPRISGRVTGAFLPFRLQAGFSQRHFAPWRVS